MTAEEVYKQKCRKTPGCTVGHFEPNRSQKNNGNMRFLTNFDNWQMLKHLEGIQILLLFALSGLKLTTVLGMVVEIFVTFFEEWCGIISSYALFHTFCVF